MSWNLSCSIDYISNDQFTGEKLNKYKKKRYNQNKKSCTGFFSAVYWSKRIDSAVVCVCNFVSVTMKTEA